MRALALLLLIGCAVPHPPPAPPRVTRIGLRITQSELPNGLRVVLVQDPKASEVQVTMRYQVGAGDDPVDQPGVAHLVEHLMFEQVLGGESLFATLESVASSFNAYTRYDSTTYFARARREHLDRLLSIEAVRLGFRCTSITDSVFERERAIVVNETRQRGSSSALRALYGALYPEHHPYRHDIGGTPDRVLAISRQQACAFADAYYAPRNAVLVISGDLDGSAVDAALAKFLGRIPARAVGVRNPVPRPAANAQRVEVKAQVDEKLVVLAWPLPVGAAGQARVRAIFPFAVALVDDAVKGRVSGVELGDERAPMLGIAIEAAPGETADEIIGNARGTISQLPTKLERVKTQVLGEVLFDNMRQVALYGLFTQLEDGFVRDAHLAANVVDGQPLSGVVAAELQAVGKMTQIEAVGAAKDHLGFERANVVIINPDVAATAVGVVESLSVPVHDRGQRREQLDPADAHRPAPPHPVPRGFAVRTRTLPNGLKVVLLPITSVPTIELRLVFGAGTADDPADRRGIAWLAAHDLQWLPRFANDLLKFAAAGGTDDVEVGFDATTFTARGLDMHVDILLAGLRRWVREGYYDTPAFEIVAALRREVKARGELAGLVDAWRGALYGETHAYARAGVAQHFNSKITIADLERFRRRYYTPDNATLVIAGGFDPDVADRWIDFVYGDWSGRVAPRDTDRAATTVTSLASDETRSQVLIQIAIPVGDKPRSHQLVEAEMLEIVAGDVRHQLGASYAFHAGLAADRRATVYTLGGWVEDARVKEAIELVQTRVAELRSDPDIAARTFVAARTRVSNRLLAMTGSSGELAARIADDAASGRPPLSDRATADEVRLLTIDQLSLADLDLGAAAILMRGPKATVESAFAVLGRTPRFVKARTVVEPPTSVDAKHVDPGYVYFGFDASLTGQPTPRGFDFTLAAGYGLGRILDHGASGPTVAASGAYRLDRKLSIGAQVSINRLAGRFIKEEVITAPEGTVDGTAGRLTVFLGVENSRVRGLLHAGLQLDRYNQEDPFEGRTEDGGLGFALAGEVAIDVAHHKRFRVGMVLRGDISVAGSNWAALGAGLFVGR
jgi:zinc protease